MAEAVVSFLVERVGYFINHEGRSLSGVRDQVRRVLDDLVFIRGFLKDADAKQQESETIRIFVARTRDAAYDLEDVIETFILKVDSRRQGGLKNAMKRLGCIFIEAAHRHKIANQIGVITTTISDLTRNCQRYDVLRDQGDNGGATSLSSMRRTYSHVIERNVVGLEDSVHELAKHLVKEEHRHRVVSIWGMGGSGKSTLAKEVFHHKDVRQHFDCFAWVCISQQYQVRDVWETIYVKLISAKENERKKKKKKRKEIATLKDDEIPGRLSRVQKEKKCLIVLDDIWKMETWDSLKAAFECDEDSKSRILLTTRKENLVFHADVNGFNYSPPRLDETKSWELFKKIAMHGRNAEIDSENYKKMEELGKDMVQRCKGLPLAITVLAGLLAGKSTVNDWITIRENVNGYISRGVGRSQEGHQYTSPVLASSYDDLPYHLKPCFIYLGLFPEGHVIQVKSLTRLWIAEGFIPFTHDGGETMEDVAYNWLNELVQRCMIQEKGRSLTHGKIKTCRMHDLLRDLCLLKAEKENFLQVVKCSRKNETQDPFSSFSTETNASEIGKIRRLAVYLEEDVEKLVPSRDERGGHLRSLLYFCPNNYYWFPKRKELIPSMFKDFKLLRVLRIEGMVGDVNIELPSEIGNMVHLRFLSLRESGIKSFPPFLGNLVCLQTLDFRVAYRDGGIVIPNVIWKMKRLRHLYLPWKYTVIGGKLKLSTPSDIQTLYNVSSRYCDLNDLTKLGNLRKLAIILSSSPSKNLEKILEAAGSVLNGIRSLELDNDDRVESGAEAMTQISARCGQIYKLKLWGPILELPNECSNLTKLHLLGCALKNDQMAILHKLPHLMWLELVFNVFEETTKVLVFSDGSFPRLQFLSLFRVDGITEWRVEEGAMPSLFKLVICECKELRTVPDGLRHLKHLNELHISGMPELFCSNLKEGGEDFHKVQHIPSLLIKIKRDHASTSA